MNVKMRNISKNTRSPYRLVYNYDSHLHNISQEKRSEIPGVFNNILMVL